MKPMVYDFKQNVCWKCGMPRPPWQMLCDNCTARKQRGQLGQIVVILFGLIFLIFVFAMMGSMQSLSDGVVSANPTMPSEIQGLIRITPFLIVVMFIVGVAAKVGSPSAA